MKRDIDLVRRILLAMEAHPAGFAPPDFTIAGYDQDVIGHHVYLMAQGGLVTATPMHESGNSPVALPLALTWAGHEFLDVVRTDTIWSKVKTQLKDHAITVPFSLLQALALQLAAAHLGLPPHR